MPGNSFKDCLPPNHGEIYMDLWIATGVQCRRSVSYSPLDLNVKTHVSDNVIS
jgi:hypothetical protein